MRIVGFGASHVGIKLGSCSPKLSLSRSIVLLEQEHYTWLSFVEKYEGKAVVDRPTNKNDKKKNPELSCEECNSIFRYFRKQDLISNLPRIYLEFSFEFTIWLSFNNFLIFRYFSQNISVPIAPRFEIFLNGSLFVHFVVDVRSWRSERYPCVQGPRSAFSSWGG